MAEYMFGASMKHLVAAACVTIAVTSVAGAADMPTKAAPQVADVTAPPPWALTFSTEVRYFSWKSNIGTPAAAGSVNNPGSGSELYIPFAGQLVGKPTNDIKVEMLVRGGWVRARQNTVGLAGEVATSTDTVANGTVTYLGWKGFQPFASISFNLPTGRSELFGRAANARMDPDLVDIASFGEGFNVGPSLGFNVPITGTLIATTSIGYTWRDNYARESSLSSTNPTVQAPTSVAPGEVWTVTQSLAESWGPWSGSVTGSFTWETPTYENGIPLYKAGDRYLATGTVSYTWTNGQQTTLTGSYSHSNRNEVLFAGATQLFKELMNTNSDVELIRLQHLIPFDRVTVGPTGSFLHRNHNGYNATTFQFVPEKDRWNAGIIARYAPADNILINAEVDRIWVREGAHPSDHDDAMFSALSGVFVTQAAIPVVSANGWKAVVGATARF
jgi:hypothetical protein